MGFSAFWVEKNEQGFTRSIIEREITDLPEGEVVIDVQFSSLNFKDGLSATGNPGVTRKFPHTPGIDAAGAVLESSDDSFKAGDKVIVTGYDLGMNTHGGFAQRIRIPAAWIIAMPPQLTAQTSMILGTAGFTAAECIDKLETAGMTPSSGPVLVTGASGGVGSVAVKILAHLGYEVAVVTGKVEQHEFLTSLGASEILSREDAAAGAGRPLLAERWGGVVDTVGGDIMFNAVKSLRYGCSLAACGLVAGADFQGSVLPFLLRNVNMLGVDSVELPLSEKSRIWNRLANEWLIDFSDLEETLSLDTLSDGLDRILAGAMVGRGVLHL